MDNEIRDNFQTLVQDQFSDLQTLGFRLSEASKPLYLIYSSQKIELIVCVDASLGELEVGFARISSSHDCTPVYGLGEIIKVFDREAGAAFRDPVVRTKAQLAEQLGELAKLVKTYGRELLSGDLKVLSQVDKLRSSAGMNEPTSQL